MKNRDPIIGIIDAKIARCEAEIERAVERLVSHRKFTGTAFEAEKRRIMRAIKEIERKMQNESEH